MHFGVGVWLFGTSFTVLQIQFISYSVLDSQCTFLKPTFQALVDFGIIIPEDGNCFQINGEFHWVGLGLICMSCLIRYFVSGLVLEETHYAVKHREMVALTGGNSCRLFLAFYARRRGGSKDWY